MNVRWLVVGCVALAAAVSAYTWTELNDTQVVRPVPGMPTLNEVALEGRALFIASCSECHGANVEGTPAGPSLIHKIYEPSHHGDESFQRAVSLGVRAHHWSFGDMPRIEGLGRPSVEKIIAYVRVVQRHNGIN